MTEIRIQFPNPPGAIPVGSRMRLHGLKGASYLNGAEGEVTAPASSQPDQPGSPRYPIRLLSPKSAVAAHPEGVRVREANLEMTYDVLSLTKLGRLETRGAPLTPENARNAVEAFMRALEADRFPGKELEGLFGVHMPASGRGGTPDRMQRAPIGQLVLGAWQELMQVLHLQRLQEFGATQQELEFALLSACIGGMDALRVMGGPRGPQLVAVVQATRREFITQVALVLASGRLPQWFEGEVRRMAAIDSRPPKQPHGSELCRRGFEGVPWDMQALERLKAAG